MNHYSVELTGPTLTVGFAVSIPILAAVIAFAWRSSRRGRQGSDRGE